MRQKGLEVTSPLANEVSLNLLLVVMGSKPFAVIGMPREASWHVCADFSRGHPVGMGKGKGPKAPVQDS